MDLLFLNSIILRVKEVQLDLREKKESLASKDHPDREVWLVLKARKEAQAIQVSQDLTASLVNKDQRENRARTVWTAKQAKLVFQVKLVLPVKWDCPVPRANLDRKDLPVFKAAQVFLAIRVTREHRVYQVHKDRQEIKVSTDLKDLLDFAVHLDPL